MPAPNLGLVGAYGAQGVQEAIQQMVAERRAAEKLAFEQAIANRRAAVEEQNAKTNEYEALARLNARSPTDVVRGLKSADPTKAGAYVVGIDPTGNRIWEAAQEPDAANVGSSDAFERFVRETVQPERLRDWVKSGNPGAPPPLTVEEVIDLRRRHAAYAPAMVQGTFGPMTTAGDPLRQSTQYITGPDQLPVGRPIDAGTAQRLAQIANVDQAAQKVQQYYKPEWVGPIEGRKNQLLFNAPDAWTPDWLAKTTPEKAQMGVWRAAMENATIQKLTGAQMSEYETERIKGQIPQWSDAPNIFEAKLGMTLENNKMLDQKLLQLSGASVGVGGQLPPGFKLPEGVKPPGAGGTPRPGPSFFPSPTQTPSAGTRGPTPQTAADMQDQIKPYTNRSFVPVKKDGVWWGKDQQGNWVQVSDDGKFIIGR